VGTPNPAGVTGLHQLTLIHSEEDMDWAVRNRFLVWSTDLIRSPILCVAIYISSLFYETGKFCNLLHKLHEFKPSYNASSIPSNCTQFACQANISKPPATYVTRRAQEFGLLIVFWFSFFRILVCIMLHKGRCIGIKYAEISLRQFHCVHKEDQISHDTRQESPSQEVSSGDSI
jgi:hypothetical protein